MCLLLHALFDPSNDDHKDKHYDMREYWDEEEFYEKNGEDFDSYEDAVEYYFKHGGY